MRACMHISQERTLDGLLPPTLLRISVFALKVRLPSACIISQLEWNVIIVETVVHSLPVLLGV
jgi:hypothetical protein